LQNSYSATGCRIAELYIYIYGVLVSPAICVVLFARLLDGTDDAPDETLEVALMDKTSCAKMVVLAYLPRSFFTKVLPHMHQIEHVVGIWQAIWEMFASQNQAKVKNPRISLENMKKIQLCTQAFLTKMQGVIEKLAILGCSMIDKEVISLS
jgi:hypothetical protein